MKGGKEREAPTHLIEILKLTHAARVTKNKSGSGQTNHRMLSRIFAVSITKTWQSSRSLQRVEESAFFRLDL